MSVRSLRYSLGPDQLAIYRSTFAFLENRLGKRESINWALGLDDSKVAERLAALAAIDTEKGRTIGEPWQSAWRLIEESWSGGSVPDRTSSEWYELGARVKFGDRSGSLIDDIAAIVRPRVCVEPFSQLHSHFKSPQRKPKTPRDLFSVSLTSGTYPAQAELNLSLIKETQFLVELADTLDAAVIRGVNIGSRLGWPGEGSFWRLGDLKRVYYVAAHARPSQDHEPDEFNSGIAPSTKLLHSVVTHLQKISSDAARRFVDRFRRTDTAVHLRLWAAFACDDRYGTAQEVFTFLLHASDSQFWDIHNYPEIAELRARRFGSLNEHEQAGVLGRILKGPPRKMWSSKTPRLDVRGAIAYWIARELRRIEVAGGKLPPTAHIEDLSTDSAAEIAAMSSVDCDFLVTPRAHVVEPNPDAKFDFLNGAERLRALEAALRTRGTWDQDPSSGAGDWLRSKGNSLKVVEDLWGLKDAGADYPSVWDRIGWNLAPPSLETANAATRTTARQVLTMLVKLPGGVVQEAIDGLSHWMSSWSKFFVADKEFTGAWFLLWPAAVAKTNREQHEGDAPSLNVVVQTVRGEPRDLDTLNTASGKLVGAFLSLCPDLEKHPRPFVRGNLRTLRDAAIAVPGRARLISLYRFIEYLPWFLRADRKWTEAQLLAPLSQESEESLVLWRAVARSTRFFETLKLIGAKSVARAIDLKLSKENRKSLVFSLVIEILHSYKDSREPAVPIADVQQMLRLVEDEVRAHAADCVSRFQGEISRDGGHWTAERLFDAAVQPFIENVWPQERSLVSQGVARAFSDLPSACGKRFAEAVNLVLRFIVPFEAWSLQDFGFYGDEDNVPKLRRIATPQTAKAFLSLLDAAIGHTDSSVVPMDLGDALDQIRRVDPKLGAAQDFRRLETAIRR
jgi:hypothetical protein